MKENTVQKAYSSVVAFLQKHRHQPHIDPPVWEELHGKLAFLGFTPRVIEAISLWTAINLENHEPSKVKWRVLHEGESQFINRETHSRLLEAQLAGMLSTRQLERVLDELVGREFQMIAPDHIHNMLAQAWSKNIQDVQNLRVN
jgi:hypothetical protein